METLNLFAEDGPARTSPWLDAVLDWLASDPDYSTSSCASLLKRLPVGFSQRTSLAFCRSNDGRDMGTVLTTLGELGYGFAYRVLDAQYFGVAQRRRRVFIVGCLGDARRAAEVLLEPESCSGDPAPSRQAGQGVAGTLETRPTDARHRAEDGHLISTGFQPTDGQDFRVFDEVSPTVKVGSGVGIASPPGVVTMRWREGKPGGGKGALLSEDKSLTLATSNDQTVFAVRRSQQSSNGWGINDGTSYTLDSTATQAISTGMMVRRLTPVECARLQGFPDDWNEGLPDSQRYKQFGNAVCVPVAEWVGRRIMEIA